MSVERRSSKGPKLDVKEAVAAAPPRSPHQAAQQEEPPSSGPGVIRAMTLVGGIYACFIFWGYMQERVTSQAYQPGTPGGKPGKWRFMVTLNSKYSVVVLSALVGIYHDHHP